METQSLPQRGISFLQALVDREKERFGRRVTHWAVAVYLFFVAALIALLALGWLTFVAWSMLQRSTGWSDVQSAALVASVLAILSAAAFFTFNGVRRDDDVAEDDESQEVRDSGRELADGVRQIIHDADPRVLAQKHAPAILAGAALFGFVLGVRHESALRADTSDQRAHTT